MKPEVIKNDNEIHTDLTILLGKDEYGKDLSINLSTTKHLLIAGCTGSGKSVLLHKIISTLLKLNSPGNLKFILADLKLIELTVYNEVPYLLGPVITDPKLVVKALKWVAKEIDRRYDIFKDNKCRSISEYQGVERMPHIVIVIDEFSDLMLTYPMETEPQVLKIAQMGHVAGVHLILSTSRPDKKIFTTSIRDAISARVALQTASVQDSKVIISIEDACRLRGAGDMLFRDGLKYPIHGQVEMISYEEVKSLCSLLRNTYKDSTTNEMVAHESPDETFDETYDDLYEGAKQLVIESGKASTSFLQRKFSIGYARSARLMDLLEERGVIGPSNGAGPREVMVKK